MKDLISYLVVMIVCFVVSSAGIFYLLTTFGPTLWAGVLEATTQITQAIVAGQVAH